MSKYPKDRDNNINIFCDTLKQSNSLHKPKGIRYDGLINNYDIAPRFDKKVEIVITNTNCIDVCIEESKTLSHIMLLNMASEFCPGGGVKKGSTAQEEVICRCTSLYPTISSHMYPLSPSECIFSPKVFIIKDGNYKKLDHTNYSQISVYSMAALRRPQLKNGKYYRQDKELMRSKIQMLLQTAYYHQQKVLVLGAWGCGVFSNPESEVAELFKTELDTTYKFAFDKVIFAILEFDPNEPLNAAFKKVFE